MINIYCLHATANTTAWPRCELFSINSITIGNGFWCEDKFTWIRKTSLRDCIAYTTTYWTPTITRKDLNNPNNSVSDLHKLFLKALSLNTELLSSWRQNLVEKALRVGMYKNRAIHSDYSISYRLAIFISHHTTESLMNLAIQTETLIRDVIFTISLFFSRL